MTSGTRTVDAASHAAVSRFLFLIQTSLKSNGGKGKLDPTLWMWTVNLIYLALAIVPNLCKYRAGPPPARQFFA